MNPVSILLIEDNPGDADLLREMLAHVTEAAFDLAATERLSSGLQLMAERNFDLLLLDLSLPDSDGMETFQVAHAAHPETPIIVLTGFDDQDRALQAMEMGAQDYLVKGRLNADLLVRSIRYARARKKAEDEQRAAQLAYEKEHYVAEALQKALLPERIPTIAGIELCQRYEAGGAQVGGDWYDVIPLAHGKLGLVMGDVAGRGVLAASLMGQLRNALRAYAIEGHRPKVVVEKLDRYIEMLGLDDLLVTLVYAVFDPDTGELRFVCAGHPPPLLVQPSGVMDFMVPAQALPLGVAPGGRYDEGCVVLAEGGTFLLYTDGLVENRLTSLEEGMENLKTLFQKGPSDLEELCDFIFDEVLATHQGWHDDMAALGIRLTPVDPNSLHLVLPAESRVLHSMRKMVLKWLKAGDVPDEAAHEIQLACAEACSNVVQHAYRSSTADLVIDAHREGAEVKVVVRDRGTWQPPQESAHGRGIGLMRSLMDTVDLRHGPDGTEVRMTKTIRGMSDGMEQGTA